MHQPLSIRYLVVHGSGSSPVTLKEAGLKEAETILAVTNSDEINLVACLVADILSPSVKKKLYACEIPILMTITTFSVKFPLALIL